MKELHKGTQKTEWTQTWGKLEVTATPKLRSQVQEYPNYLVKDAF